MHAVIMAGGKGTRLFPYTALLPKPLMPLGDMPVLELVLRQLRAHGVREVVLAVNHLHHLIRSFFGDGGSLGLKIDYWIEDAPLGTCGALAGFLDRLPSRFFLMNGDLLTDLSFSDLAAFHAQKDASVTVATFRRRLRVEFGVLQVNGEGHVLGVEEKPEFVHPVSMGIYLLERDAVRPFLPTLQRKDMPSLLTDLIAARQVVASYSEDCTWLDIGNPDDYAKAQAAMTENPSLFLPRPLRAAG